jgi:hypothetical protein
MQQYCKMLVFQTRYLLSPVTTKSQVLTFFMTDLVTKAYTPLQSVTPFAAFPVNAFPVNSSNTEPHLLNTALNTGLNTGLNNGNNSAFPVAYENRPALTYVTPEQENNPQTRTGAAFAALGLIGLGLLLNRIPAKASAFEMVSTRLEDWVKMALGVMAVGKINAAIGGPKTPWQPKPWQHGLETVTVLTFITQGLNLKGWKHFPLLAVSVPLLVQATHWLTNKAEAYLDKHNSPLPRWVPKLGITLASTVGGVYGLRGIMQTPVYNKTMGNLGATSGQQALGAEVLVCSRCGGAHLVCMEEVSDFIGSMAGWFKQRLSKESKTT